MGGIVSEAKITLQIKKPHQLYGYSGFPWASCLPFVENSRGVLIHRPRYGMTYNLNKLPHIGVEFWCGMATTTSGKNLTFLSSPPENRILCERCERIATDNGLPSADEMAGRRVHKGRTVPVITCCAAETGRTTP